MYNFKLVTRVMISVIFALLLRFVRQFLALSWREQPAIVFYFKSVLTLQGSWISCKGGYISPDSRLTICSQITVIGANHHPTKEELATPEQL